MMWVWKSRTRSPKPSRILPSPACTARSAKVMSVTMPSIWPVLIDASDVRGGEPTISMPCAPQPCCRDSSTASQPVSERAEETPILRPLRSAAVAAHQQHEIDRRSEWHGDALHRRAPLQQSQLRACTHADVDTVSRQRLLQPRAAPEGGDLDIEPMAFEDAFSHADIERQERECFGHGLANPQFFLR